MGHDDKLVSELEAIADRLRLNCFDEFITKEQGHVGGTMSSVDIMTALYFHHINFNKDDPDWHGRDRIIMSKAHCCESTYAALVELGVYPKETLSKYYCYESPFQGHADRWCTKGIDYSGGSLGQGLSFGCGLAYAEKLDQKLFPVKPEGWAPRFVQKYPPAYRTYVVVGDGELNEGNNWEAAMFAAKFKLDNLTCIIDYNKWQIAGPSADIMPLEPLAAKWQAFGWSVQEVDGHNMRQLVDALDLADRRYGDNLPKCIIAHTVKGYGVPMWADSHMHMARGAAVKTGVQQGRTKYGQV